MSRGRRWAGTRKAALACPVPYPQKRAILFINYWGKNTVRCWKMCLANSSGGWHLWRCNATVLACCVQACDRFHWLAVDDVMCIVCSKSLVIVIYSGFRVLGCKQAVSVSFLPVWNSLVCWFYRFKCRKNRKKESNTFFPSSLHNDISCKISLTF